MTDGDGELEKQGKRRGREGEWLRVTQTKRDRDGEKQITVRVSFRKQTLRQRCVTCTFSPLNNPEGVWRGGKTDRQQEPEKEKSQMEREE